MMADTLSVTLSSSITTANVVQNGPPFAFTDTNIVARLIDKIQIPAGSTDLAIGVDIGSARYLILKFTGSVSVKLNSTGNTALALTAAASNPAGLLIAGGTITAIYVSNAGASAVDCERLLAA